MPMLPSESTVNLHSRGTICYSLHASPLPAGRLSVRQCSAREQCCAIVKKRLTSHQTLLSWATSEERKTGERKIEQCKRDPCKKERWRVDQSGGGARHRAVVHEGHVHHRPELTIKHFSGVILFPEPLQERGIHLFRLQGARPCGPVAHASLPGVAIDGARALDGVLHQRHGIGAARPAGGVPA